MVADVTETRNVIPSLEFKTCMTIKFLSFHCIIISLFFIFLPSLFSILTGFSIIA